MTFVIKLCPSFVLSLSISRDRDGAEEGHFYYQPPTKPIVVTPPQLCPVSPTNPVTVTSTQLCPVIYDLSYIVHKHNVQRGIRPSWAVTPFLQSVSPIFFSRPAAVAKRKAAGRPAVAVSNSRGWWWPLTTPLFYICYSNYRPTVGLHHDLKQVTVVRNVTYCRSTRTFSLNDSLEHSISVLHSKSLSCCQHRGEEKSIGQDTAYNRSTKGD